MVYSNNNPFSLELFDETLSPDALAAVGSTVMSYFSKPAFNNSTQLSAEAFLTDAGTLVQKHYYVPKDDNPDFFAAKSLRKDGTSTFTIYDMSGVDKLILSFDDKKKPTQMTDISLVTSDPMDKIETGMFRYKQSVLATYAPNEDIVSAIRQTKNRKKRRNIMN